MRQLNFYQSFKRLIAQNCLYIRKQESLKGTPVEVKEVSPQLIAQAKSGNTSAFEDIYRIYVGRVYSVCLRILGDHFRAEEATQQIFIRSWTKLDSFRGEGSFGSWLYRLAVNTALNDLKAAASMHMRDSCSDDHEARSAYQGKISWETQMDLEKAIAALPAGARAVFVLHDIEGFKHKDIACKLGLENGTCRAQLFRARKLLREALKRS